MFLLCLIQLHDVWQIRVWHDWNGKVGCVNELDAGSSCSLERPTCSLASMVQAVVCSSAAVSWQPEKNMVSILSPQCLEAERHLLGYPHSACQSFLYPAARSSPGSLVFVVLSRSLHQQATACA